MGTTYHIKVVTGYFKRPSGLQEKIDRRLVELNRSMSAYLEDSELSRFNVDTRVGEKFHISGDFLRVMMVAQKLYRITDGAWDGTISPLVNLWGFGSSQNQKHIPEKEVIQALLGDIGFKHIEVSQEGYLLKKKASISVDLASIAKGYAVDQVAGLIRDHGIENFIVEIGGEVFASGFRKDGQPWRVGINRPEAGANYNQVYKALDLQESALATSGDYRNFFEIEGVRYSHVLDPRTGYPVVNGVVSVSVRADTCTVADGLATAIMVLGAERGLKLVNGLDRVECLIVVRKENGEWVDYFSKGFEMRS